MLFYFSMRSDRYSRTVRVFKFILPVMAAALLLPIILATKGLDRSEVTSALLGDFPERYNDTWIGEVNANAVLDNGSVMILQATSGQLDVLDRIRLLDVDIEITSEQGGLTKITSDVAFVTSEDGLIDLEGNVRVVEASGYNLSTESLSLSSRSGKIQSNEETFVTSLFGSIIGGQFDHDGSNEEGAGSIVSFSNGVTFRFDQRSD